MKPILPRHIAVCPPLVDRPLAHCATLVVLPDDDLLAAWYAGSYETAPDVVILAARLDRSHGRWSEVWPVVDVAGRSAGQPVFLLQPPDTLWLYFVIIDRDKTGWTGARPYRQSSSNWGQTWTQAELLFDYPGLMLRNRPLRLEGRIVLPVYDESTWRSRMALSDDDGRTWRLTPPIESPTGNIHPALVELRDGRLLAYLRPGGQGGTIWWAESSDRGETWTDPAPTAVPNSNSGLDLLRLQSGRLALAFDDSPRLRTPLRIALAEQDLRWRWVRTIEDGVGEFSYPTLAQTRDGWIHIVYTYRREHIEYATLAETWLEEGGCYREDKG